MQKKEDKYVLSAGDINGFLNCKRLTQLDTQVANGSLLKPEFNNPHIKTMQERGFEHEKNYVECLQSEGFLIKTAASEEDVGAYQKTKDLMKEGVDVITQGVLVLDGWYGRSDVLFKVEKSSDLGEHSYIVMDTKLARETKTGAIMQLCLYSEMLSKIQGVMPEIMYVVTPGEENSFNKEEYRVDDYQAYYRLVRDKLIAALGKIEAYPEPVTHCDMCRWWGNCSKKRRDDNHLSLVANISKRRFKQ